MKKRSIQEIEGISYTEYEGVKVSKDEKAKELMGYRQEGHPGANALDYPVELGYACPICGASDEVNLLWSEYSGFIWCKKCNLDIPSCLCVRYARCSDKPYVHGVRPLSRRKLVEKQTAVFLSTVEDAIGRKLAVVLYGRLAGKKLDARTSILMGKVGKELTNTGAGRDGKGRSG